MQTIHAITDICERYDAFIIDLWGVMHDGTALYPGAAEALNTLREQNKQILFLSNAPRQAQVAEATLDRLGIARDRYDYLLTSGQVAHDYLAEHRDWGTHYYYVGPGKDEAVLDDLAHYHCVDDMQYADFILNTGFEYDYQIEEEIIPLLQELLSYKLPLICINPDIEVVKQDGMRLLCAGWVAEKYKAMGGRIHYFGKPYPYIYERCLAQFGISDSSRILAIGDNLQTDIKGANGMGIDSLLITGGIMKGDAGHLPDEEEIRAATQKAGVMPTYVCERFIA